jgi:RND family efflux transporter MFP subunit
MVPPGSLEKDLPRISRSTLTLLGGITLLALAALLAVGIVPKVLNRRALAQRAQAVAEEKPIVEVVRPKPESDVVHLTLPGDVSPMQQTALYAQITGYLKEWRVDIGDHVKKGDLLAVIDAPLVDANLQQAEATLLRAQDNVNNQQTNYNLANATYERYLGLVPTHSVTQQQIDERQTAMEAAASALKQARDDVLSAQATVQNLRAQQAYERIFAPFDGVITRRNYDIGALITASATGVGQELFDLAQVDKLRVYVNVPQVFVTQLQPAQPVHFTTRNYPGRSFPGAMARTMGALDPRTRTLRTELDFDNPQALLWAGMYGDIVFDLHPEQPTLTVPTSTLIFASTGTQVALVGADNIVHFQPVSVGKDFGMEIEIVTGLTGTERVIANPGEKLAEGLEVTTAVANSPPATPPATAPRVAGPTPPSLTATGDK